MKLLLLGKDGQVGWELQRSLAPLGEVVALDFDSQEMCGDFSNLAGLAETVRQVRPNVIVNAAAHTAVDKAEAEPELVHAINAAAVGVLAREVAARDAWLVHYSTDYVFDGSGSTPWIEDSPTGPLSVYGKTKLEGEDAIRASGAKHLIFRTSWVYAARGGNFAKTMLRLAAERDTLEVVTDQVGQPTWTVDLAQQIVRMLDADAPAGVYHGTSSGSASWYDFARAIFAERGLDPERIRPTSSSSYPRPAPRPAYSVLGHGAWAAHGLPGLRPWREALAEAAATGALDA